MVSDARIVRRPADLRALMGSETTGLVPTMGALHEGHRSLIERSARENRTTVVSVFVNPTQFTNPQDLVAYPRRLEADAQFAFEAGANLIYAPEPETVYPAGFQTSVDPGPLATRWEGEFRPGHFRGVATVVAILLNTVRPARSYFGEKDYQQLCVVRQMARDLLLPGGIVGSPTIRAADGLALSSRNARLSEGERAIAVAIPRALFSIRAAVSTGDPDNSGIVEVERARLAQTPGVTVEYVAVVHPETLDPIQRMVPGARALIAVKLGEIRLIDNLDIST